MPAPGFRIRLLDDPRRVERAAWDALVQADPAGNVFLRHAFLSALHESGAARPDRGWLPQWLTVWEERRSENQLAAAIPLYLKGHSYGEYVFDWAWAEAQERAGGRYYPKWLVAVPFTPVEGSRILARDATARAAALSALLELVRGAEFSSLHILFAPADQTALMAAAGLLVREGVQFHWSNRGYRDFEQFLGALTQPKRKKIRAERRKVAEAGVRLERRVGAGITAADWEFFYRCYENTYAEHGGTPYLDLDFFLRIAGDLPQHLLLVRATRGARPVASALGVLDARRGALYGRYWGALEPVSCLHFECCYYQMIEFAIERGLASFEGGAQGAHKLARGLDPVPTYSAHWLRDPPLQAAVAQFLARERESVERTIDELAEHRALRD